MDIPMLTLIEGGDVFTPEPIGITSILLANDRVAKLGSADGRALAALKGVTQCIDASGCVVVPGFIDPHANVIGAGGEQGFGSRQPEVTIENCSRPESRRWLASSGPTQPLEP